GDVFAVIVARADTAETGVPRQKGAVPELTQRAEADEFIIRTAASLAKAVYVPVAGLGPRGKRLATIRSTIQKPGPNALGAIFGEERPVSLIAQSRHLARGAWTCVAGLLIRPHGPGGHTGSAGDRIAGIGRTARFCFCSRLSRCFRSGLAGLGRCGLCSLPAFAFHPIA